MPYKDPEKRRACQRASMRLYRTTEHGRAKEREYQQRPEVKERVRQYGRSPAGRASKLKHYRTGGGRENQSVRKAQEQIDAMVAEHPELEELNALSKLC